MFSEREEAIALAEAAASIEEMRSGLRIVLSVWVLGYVFTPLVLLDAAWLAALVALGIVTALVSLVGFRRLASGAAELARVEPELTTASVLIRVGWVGGLVLLLVGLLLLLLVVGVFLLLIAAVLLLLGVVGLIMLSFRMRDIYGEPLYGTSGGLLVLGIVLGIVLALVLGGLGSAVSGALFLASLAILYAAMGRTIKSLREESARARTPPQLV